MTDAALYEELRYGQLGPQDSVSLPAPTPTPATAVPVPPFAAEDAPAPVWDDEFDGTGIAPASSVVEHDPQA